MFTLEQVRGFVAVAEELHFGRAAVRLNITQPPLSRQVQKLEEELGVKLLERNARGVRLTPAGAAFYDDAVRLLRLAQNAPDTARKIADGWSGTLRVGFTGGSAMHFLGGLLTRMSVDLPDVNLELNELVTSRQLKSLTSGDIDLGLGRPPFDHSQFDNLLVQSERLVAVIPVAHPLTHLRRPLVGTDFAGVDFIMHSPSQARYFHDLTTVVLAGHHVQPVHTVSQVLTIVELVAAGRGVALVPESASRLAISGVRFMPLIDDTPPVELHAVWFRDNTNPALPRLQAMLTRHVNDSYSASHHPKNALD